MNKLILILGLAFIISCNHPHYDNPHVIIATNFGDIEVELYPAKAPKTVTAFLSYVNSGLYNNSSFYRVLIGEEMPAGSATGLVQGGVWKTAPQKEKNTPGIEHESTKQTGLSHTDGIISMARADSSAAKTEFFICIGDQTNLNFKENTPANGQGYAAFGKVFSGMDIVRKIQKQNSHGDSFDEPVSIQKITSL